MKNRHAIFVLTFLSSICLAQQPLNKVDESTWRTCTVRGSPDGDVFPVALGEQQTYLIQTPSNLGGKSIIYTRDSDTTNSYTFRSGPVSVEFSKDLQRIIFNFSANKKIYRGTCHK
jgi:hypothetical protein